MLRRSSMLIAVAIAWTLSIPAPANAATPQVVWSAAGMGAPAFSSDGSLALAIANTSAGGRLDVSNDDSLVLTGRAAAPRRSLRLTDRATVATVAAYDFGADVFAGDLSPDSALFTYALTTAPSAFDGHAARHP